MPTTLDRTSITHTSAVERLLQVAEDRWPGKTPRELMLSLMEQGARNVAQEQRAWRDQVDAASHNLSDLLQGVIPATLVEDNRSEWPA